MHVFKFGGASVRDAAGIRNVGRIISQTIADGAELLVVVSAMGKTTNALEEVVVSHMAGRADEAQLRWQNVVIAHELIVAEFELSEALLAPVRETFATVATQLTTPAMQGYDEVYDQIVSMGEIISTQLLAAYLTHLGLPVQWTDARQLIRTDDTFREGRVDWTTTETQIQSLMATKPGLVLTQGFIGGTPTGGTTTLGREGSDYSAAIFAYCTQAQDVTIWKDVPGVLNADPRYFDETVLLPSLTYQDATELAYYGATVIHPKTIKPLQNKGIPLYVRSFVQPDQPGTMVGGPPVPNPTPSFIFKVNQLLISLHPTDFSFIAEDNLSLIFGLFAEAGVKINLMQNTALNFSVVVDSRPERIPDLLERLREHFRVTYNEALELITIRHYDQSTIDRVLVGKTMLLEQKSRITVQLVVRDEGGN
ncbi:aspartate kinase [Fibrella aestuarina BUZ 2]|uniref:Aspartokinase n=1 Tax=Fibrella aestuarina BUZ 2 TaxID=1166018 RepID=I0KGH3_9BACT|nr:aspartate kinase [Fibrella aestuarina]CCH03226.1 aspartate kinase [Fibrella aestuarina BUZ 2]